MNIHPATFAEIQRVVREVRATLGDDADEQAVQDTVEGETDTMEIVGALLAERRECLQYGAAMAVVGDEYYAKARAWNDRAERVKRLLGRVRDILGQNIKHPAGTVIVSERKPAPEVADDVDVDDLPDEFVRTKREPDKNAMKAAFAAGRNVPGVRWGDAKRQVTIK